MNFHVAYVLKSFPVLSQVTVINELTVLRDLGVQTSVVSLLQPAESALHAAAEELQEQVVYWWGGRRSRPTVLRSNLDAIVRSGWGSYRQAWRLVEEIGLLKGFLAFARLVDTTSQLRERGVRHLHAHFATEATTVAHALSLISGLPFSFTAHAFDIFLVPHRLGEKMQAACSVVTVSEYNKRYMLERWPGVPDEKIHVVRPGVDLHRFSPDRPASLEDGRFRIFSVGRLVEKKGYADLIEACRLMDESGLDFECAIVGDGPRRASLETVISDYGLGDRVRLMGAMPQGQFIPLLRQADVFVLPCVIAENGDRDAMPLAIEEAMAMGLPVVSTQVVGIPELVRDGAGLLVPPHSPVDLRHALGQLYHAGPEGRAAMGRQGRRIVEQHFNVQRETRKMLALFKEASTQQGGQNDHL